jgi:hypothetical protein
LLDKKTKRELALDFMENFMNEGTSKDEMGVWVSQESLTKELGNIIHSLREPNFNGENIIKDYHWKEFTDLIIKKLKGEKE